MLHHLKIGNIYTHYILYINIVYILLYVIYKHCIYSIIYVKSYIQIKLKDNRDHFHKALLGNQTLSTDSSVNLAGFKNSNKSCCMTDTRFFTRET